MLKDIEALHTSRLSSPNLAKHEHGQGADWHHQLWLLTGAAESSFSSRSLQFPPAAVPRAEVIKDFKGKDAFFTVAPPGESPLREMDNVVLAPHMGSGTDEAYYSLCMAAARNIADCLDGKRPVGLVNPACEPRSEEIV